MALDPTRRSPRLLAVLAAFALVPLLGACNDDGDDDNDDDNDDSMPAVTMLVPR